VGAFPVWRPNLDEVDVDSAPASAFLILKSFKIIPLQLGCRVPARVLACLLSDGPVLASRRAKLVEIVSRESGLKAQETKN
jgi:hypothetical protein